MSRLNTMLERSNSQHRREDEYWAGGEGPALDLTPAALDRLKARVDARRVELDDFIEHPEPKFTYFMQGGRAGDEDY